MAPAFENGQKNAGIKDRVQAGTSFEDLLAHRESVFRICLGFSRDYSEAEDLVQDVFLKAYRNIGTLIDASVSKEWLFRIAKNACLDRRKKNQTRAGLLRRWAEFGRRRDDHGAASPVDDRLAGLKETIDRLPKKLRSVFVLRLYGRLTYEEIAVTLNLAEGTVMSRLNRARKRIAEMIQEVPK